MSHKDELKSRIEKHQRRLQVLKEQKALFGVDTRPHILIEIEDTETEIECLQTELVNFEEIALINPYRGLAVFREQDAPYFFGREALTNQLAESVYQKPLVAVLGSSGSGKSSLIFAGLVPRLRRETNWLILAFRPGREPFRSLAAALLPFLELDLTERLRLKEIRGLATDFEQGNLTLTEVVTRILEKSVDTDRLLLIVDQFEELYTLSSDSKTWRQFLDVLVVKDESVLLNLVLTLRADFMGQALDYRPFADTLRENMVMLGPMEMEELRQAIEKPANGQNVSFESGLVERILADVSDEPGYLPLLEFALTALWEEQTQGELTHEAYEAIGRVEGALSRYAEKVFEDLSESEQGRARRVFTQLIRPGEGTEDTRRLARRDELTEADWVLVQKLATERLVVTDRDPDKQETVEVVHEALIRDWKRLRGWMKEDRRFRTWQERLRVALSQWQINRQDEGALLRGTLLAEAEVWLDERNRDVGQAERDFIQASVALRGREIETQEKIKRQENLLLWIMWVVVSMVGVGLSVDLVGAVGWDMNVNPSSVGHTMGVDLASVGSDLHRAISGAVGMDLLGVRWDLGKAVGWAMGGIVVGAVTGSMQWLVLRQRISGADRWVVASTAGVSVGVIVAGIIDLVLGVHLSGAVGLAIGGNLSGAVGRALVGAAVGAVCGIMQWLILRQQVSQASWWVTASTVGVATGWVVGGVMSDILFRPDDLFGTGVGIVFGTGVGFVVGAITGIALVWLLQHPSPKT